MTRRTRTLDVLCACAVALLAVARDAHGQGGVVDRILNLEESELVQGDRVVRLTKYNDQLYRRIDVTDLNSLVIDDSPLHGLQVCVEGKFDKFVPPNSFRLIGGDGPLVIMPQDRTLVAGLMRGDNLWVAGMAQKMTSGGTCYLAVRTVVRLGNDVDLFQKRFAKYRMEGKWEQLLELGRWVELSAEQIAGSRFEDSDRYRVLKDRAYRQALQLREQQITANDVEGLYELARMNVTLLGRSGRVTAVDHLLTAVEVDPDHAKVAEMLVEFGYIRFRGRWMTDTEREEIEREERAKVLAQAHPATNVPARAPETAAGQPSERTALSLVARVRRSSELEDRARLSLSGLRAVSEMLPHEEELIARRLVWIYANTAGAIGLEALLSGMRSASETVRMDIADALAASNELADLGDIVRTDKSPAVRAHAIGAMASRHTNASVDRLVTILEQVDGQTGGEIVKALQGVTGQKFTAIAPWRSWWQDNRGTFKGSGE